MVYATDCKRCFVNVSVLFNEPKLLKLRRKRRDGIGGAGFSALQRAEIAEMWTSILPSAFRYTVSVLFNEPKLLKFGTQQAQKGQQDKCFSALQRAEIAEIFRVRSRPLQRAGVSVLFNEPKLLKFDDQIRTLLSESVSVLFSEPKIPQSWPLRKWRRTTWRRFQCSSASRKFLNGGGVRHAARCLVEFQCSSASRKFLNPDPRTCVHPYFRPR